MTASQFNTHIRDNSNWLKAALNQLNVTSDAAKAQITPALVGAHAWKSANQAIADSTLTAITFNSERFDSNAFHDTATDNTRITIPSSMAGYYLIGAQATWQGNATGYRQGRIRLNGSSTLAHGHDRPSATESTFTNCFTLVLLAVADYVEFVVYQTSGGNLDVVSAPESPNFWIHRIAAS